MLNYKRNGLHLTCANLSKYSPHVRFIFVTLYSFKVFFVVKFFEFERDFKNMRLDCISPENILIRSNIYGQNIQNTFFNLETDSAREVKSNHEIAVS
jgi:hypothetical protein